MQHSDAKRWNHRYLEETRKTFTIARPFLHEVLPHLPKMGLALDIAMGLGGNAGLLIGHGLSVVGVDISDVAVRIAFQKHPKLLAVISNLEYFPIPPIKFNLILNFYYYQRNLWPKFRQALEPGGFLVFETMTKETLRLKPGLTPEYLVEKDDLANYFSDFKIIILRERWQTNRRGSNRAIVSLLAQKM